MGAEKAAVLLQPNLAAKYAEANSYIWCCLTDHVLTTGETPSIKEATSYVEAGVKILLDVLTESDATVSDHLGIRLEGLEQGQIAIHLAGRTTHGETVVQLFSQDPHGGVADC